MSPRQPATAAQPSGRLHIYLGAVPGAGKTHAMLSEGRRLADSGADVVVALLETHGREGLDQIAAGLETIPVRTIPYRGSSFGELDADAVLARHPDVALIDELAHTNVPGSRRDKRWQDVDELLRAGIDVVTTLNVQHLAELHDAVERITGVRQREFVPEALVLSADRVDFIDASPRDVLRRLGRGQSGSAGRFFGRSGFFDPGRMDSLRRLALTWLGEHGLGPGQPAGGADELAAPGPVVAALAPGAPAESVVRRAAQVAAMRQAPLVGVCVRDTTGMGTAVARGSRDLERLLAEFGGRYAEVGGADTAIELARFADREGASVLVIGDTSHYLGRRFLHGSVARRTLRLVRPIEVYVVPPRTYRRGSRPAPDERPVRWRRPALPGRRRMIAWSLAVLGPLALTAALSPARSVIGLAGALFLALLAMVGVALVGGIGAAMLATGVGVLSADFFFAPPYDSLRVARLIDVLALVVFAVVGAVIGVLVQVLAGRAGQTARAQAEADQLARLSAAVVAEQPKHPVSLVAELRAAFDLHAVGILSGSAGDWRLLAGAGGPLPDQPDAAQFAAEIAPGRVLVMNGAGLTASDSHLLRVFTAELLLARRRAQARDLEASPRGRETDGDLQASR